MGIRNLLTHSLNNKKRYYQFLPRNSSRLFHNTFVLKWHEKGIISDFLFNIPHLNVSTVSFRFQELFTPIELIWKMFFAMILDKEQGVLPWMVPKIRVTIMPLKGAFRLHVKCQVSFLVDTTRSSSSNVGDFNMWMGVELIAL